MNTHVRDIEALTAQRIEVAGHVQGVGFRPHVYRIAHALGLRGWVRNETGRVIIHVEGSTPDLRAFEVMLVEKAPPLARLHIESSQDTVAEQFRSFVILDSEESESADIHLPPDLFCCDDCVAELRNPAERRHRYAFTNCTQCGPRYTIIASLPYDRPNTSMVGFALCARCRGEYDDPLDRRFHAQPLACPDCGPALTFARTDHVQLQGDAALRGAIDLMRAGGVVAVKGVGGYHLMCDPENDEAVRVLRARKHRPHKPLAVMFPMRGGDGLDAVRACVTLDEVEAQTCADPARPIVLARRRDKIRLSDAIAPGLSELGVFLPYSPLHHLLLAEFGGSLVATSGNVSGEPVIIDNDEAQSRLSNIADGFLHHNRLIVRPADDSVVRIMEGAARPIRIGRGAAPLEIDLEKAFADPVLAVGGHMKNAIALGWNSRAVVSPHIGDLDSPRSMKVFAQVIGDLCALYRVEPRHIVCDAHPNYASTRWAPSQSLPVTRVRHHEAHASAIAGEHPGIARWLVFAWDGVGLGESGELWGGETFVGAPGNWRRVASMRSFHLLGGDRAGREPWRSAAALMWDADRDYLPDVDDAALAHQAWDKRIGTFVTSSVGRLFDAAASLVLGIDYASFEGQGPMMLESIAEPGCNAIPLPCAHDCAGMLRTDWRPLLAMLTDRSLSPGIRAGIFHESLAAALVAQVRMLARTEAFDAVGLTGGVFQNRILPERIVALLSSDGTQVYLPRVVPANDGGLAFGQLIEARARLAAL